MSTAGVVPQRISSDADGADAGLAEHVGREDRRRSVAIPAGERSEAMSNDFLASSVTDELFWDPNVNSSEITVSAEGGDITLRGTVGTLREARDAVNAAERVLGVTRVDNRLNVRVTNGTTP
jgi:osmotically-inducible protein OsmY